MTQPPRILLIDDNPNDRALVVRALRETLPDGQFEEIQNAQALSQALEAGEFDLTITDYQIRWITGLEVLQRVKQQYPDRPVVMFTGTGDEEVAVEAMKSGLDDYVIKRPNRYPYLATVVQAVLERTAIRRRAKLLEIRLQRLLNHLNIGIFRANTTGDLLECNPAFLMLLGVETLEQAQPLMQQFDLPAKYIELTNLPVPDQRIEWEVMLHQADRTQMWVLLNTAIERVNNETVVDGVVENVTVRKAAEVALQQLNEELEQRVQERTGQLETANQELSVANRKLELANENLEEFVSSVSHDLQAPFRVIGGFSRLILTDHTQEIPLAVHDYVERIQTTAERGRVLIQDLLAYSRLSRTELSLQDVNLDLAVAEAIDQLEALQSAQIRLEQPLGFVKAEYRTLVQIVINLLSNAVKFVSPGVVSQIRVWSEQRNGWIRLWVEDNGIGIASEAQARIFNVFERLHNDEDYPGTGVGLAIVRKGVDRMGGQTGVESQLAQGSQFWIELLAANN